MRSWPALGLCLLAPAALSQEPAASPAAGVPVTRLSYAEHGVELSGPDGVWRPLAEGARLRTGERVRTAADAVARLEFPFMGLTVGPDSEVAIPPGVVLSTQLVRGRVELGSERGEIIKLTTPEVEIRGEGRVVVRRAGDTTLVMALSGAFRVQAQGRTVVIERGQGTRATPGKIPGPPEPLPATPSGLQPGSDPPYSRPGTPVQLEWKSASSSHHLQVLGVDSEVVAINRDVGTPPYTLVIPWPGTFRWRVSARDARGYESLPSDEGLVCLLEK